MPRICRKFPTSLKNGLEIIPVSRMGEVLEHALTRMPEAIEWTPEMQSKAALADKTDETGAPIAH